MKTRIILLLLAPVMALTIMTFQIYAYAQQSDPDPADAAIVLGAAVWNGRPSPVFTERIKHAVDLYQRGQVQYLIFTGGVGYNDQLSEAQAAREYALAAGVPGERILTENNSTTTRENLQGAQRLLAAYGLQRVLLVSDPLHMLRAVETAQGLGIDAHPSPTPTSRYRSLRSQLPFLARELYYFAVSRLGVGLA
jgi:uncharacterized SAM-binding protein YcdF (DUF218 family)